MEPFVTREFDGPQFDDISGLQRFYGDALENNDTAATPSGLGQLPDGTTTRTTLSIDGQDDVDFYEFITTGSKSVSITVRPEGAPYLEGPQNNDGTCTAGTQFDPKTISDLGFEFYATGPDGKLNLVSSTNAQGVGGTETLPPTNLTGAGPYQIRVFGGGINNIQRYGMDVLIGAPVVEGTPGPTPVPTATPVPTPGPTATPTPAPTPPRPIVDLNGLNPDGSVEQTSPVFNGIDNTSTYFYQINDTVSAAGVRERKPAGPQFITPPETLINSDISEGNGVGGVDRPGDYIVEARIQLTPQIIGGRAPDNTSAKRDNEVLAVDAATTKFLNDQGSGLSSSYDTNTQILTIKGANTAKWGRDAIRFFYEIALYGITYENKLPIANSAFNRPPSLDDRIITYVVDTDNIAANNQDNRFQPQEPPLGGNPLQSKPAVLTLEFQEAQSLTVTTLSDAVNRIDELTSLPEAMQFANQLYVEEGSFGSFASPETITFNIPGVTAGGFDRFGRPSRLAPAPSV